MLVLYCFFFSSRRRHTRYWRDWSSDGVLFRSLDLMRLTKIPEEFEIQYCKVTGVRSELFDKLVHVLGIKSSTKNRVDLLDVVRPLCVFAAHLPAYTHKTRNLSEQALAVRKSLLKASEPSTLLFRELPEACGFAPFSANESDNDHRVHDFVDPLTK